MNKENEGPEIAIIGPYPPPYGGISVHIQRVLDYLDELKNNYDFYLENRVKGNFNVPPHNKFYGLDKIKYLFQLLFKDYFLIHHHSPDWKTRVLLSFYGMLGKSVYLHIHGASLRDTIEKGGIKSFLTKKFLKFVNIIADNSDIAQLAQKYRPKSVVVIDAFLPPLFREDIFERFIAEYGRVLQNKDYVISMVGWFNYYGGEDLYGFDIALKALQKFKKEVEKNVLLLASINGVRSEDLHEKVKKYISNNNLNKNVFFIYEELPEIWPIYLVSDVFIRPTCSDGSALSVEEALWFETPVIASNAVPRPKGVYLFQNRSADDLYENLRKLYFSRYGYRDVKEKIDRVKNKKFTYELFSKIYKLR